MSLRVKSVTAVALVVVTLSFGDSASAAPLSASLALRDTISPTAQTIWWGGGPYYGSYAYNYDCCCPPGYGYYPSTYGNYASGYYGGYGYAPYHRPYGYAPRVYGGYWGY
jgi:hypothetical protein